MEVNVCKGSEGDDRDRREVATRRVERRCASMRGKVMTEIDRRW